MFGSVPWARIGQVLSKVNSALAQVGQFLSKVADLTGIRSMVDDVIRDPGAALQQGARFLVPMAAGVLATGACIGLTGGVGTPACLVLGGAAAGAVGGAMDCGHGSDCVRSVMLGAATGAVGGLFGGPIGGRIASTLLGRAASQAISGALGAGAASVTGQLLTTGRVDLRQLGGDMLLGAALGAVGGVLGGKTTRPTTRVPAGETGVVSGATARSALGGIRVAAQPRASVWSRVSGWARKVLGGGCNSFTGDTPVLMADGSRKPIRKVKLGDKVMAADPVTGVEGPRTVVDLIRHSGAHVMVAVQLADGSVLNATDHHRFWVANRQAWVDAIDLKAGDQVVDRDGNQVVVAGVGISEQDLTAYNLTISGLHTYFVGKANILVHNDGGNPAACKIGSRAQGDGASNMIYRTGSRTDNALTDESGVSFRDSVSSSLDPDHPQVFRPGDKIWAVDINRLPAGAVVRDGVPPGHVTVNASPDEIRAAIVDDPFLTDLGLKPLDELGSYRLPK